MGAVWLTVWAEWRQRWRALAALAVIAGLAGAVAAGALAASRRADTSFERLVDQTHSPQLFVFSEQPPNSAVLERAARLPGVEMAAQVALLVVAPDDPRFRPGFDTIALAVPAMAGRERWRDRIIEGREANPADPSELVVNEAMRDALGARVGDRIRLVSLTPVQTSTALNGQDPGPPAGPAQDAVMVGVDRGAEDTSDAPEPAFAVTSAFYRLHGDRIGRLEGVALRVDEEHRATIKHDIQAIFGGADVDQSFDDLTARIEDGLDVQVFSLRAFAVAALLAGLVAVGQAISRQVAAMGSQHPARRALGMTTRQLVAAGILTALPVALAAAGLTAAGAAVGGPLAITGLAETAEPDPGPWLDLAALALGSALTGACVLALAGLAAARFARRPSHTGSASSQSSLAARLAALTGFRPAATVGTRIALETSGSRTAAPARLSLLGAAVGIAGIVAAVAFGASVDHLLHTPRLSGAWFDAIIPQGEGPATPKDPLQLASGMAARVAGQSSVEAVAVSREGKLTLTARGRETTVAVETVEPYRGVMPPVLREGREPQGTDEVALGAKSMDALHLRMGEVVPTVGTARPVPLRVVGTYVSPGVDEVDRGALLSARGFEAVVGDADSADVRVRFAAGVDVDDAVTNLRRTVTSAFRWTTPSSVDNLDELGSLPAALAVFLALLAAAAASHALVSTVRRRRADLAVLRALGFVRGQVRAVVRWQAFTVAGAGLVMGVPLGLVVARRLWSLVADGLGVVDEPATPWLLLGLAVPVTLAVAVLIATPPGMAAARARPADVLRAE
jgi:putative ABC transport system permease protein